MQSEKPEFSKLISHNSKPGTHYNRQTDDDQLLMASSSQETSCNTNGNQHSISNSNCEIGHQKRNSIAGSGMAVSSGIISAKKSLKESSTSTTSNNNNFKMASQPQGSKVKTFEKIQLKISNKHFDDHMELYTWRSKTDLPVAKVMFCKVVNRDISEEFTEISVSYETFPQSMADFKTISLPNCLYMMRQAVIGYEKLFSIFGSFLISNKMVALNKNNRCKVWINENFSINEPIAIEMFQNQTEKEFLGQILSLFQKKCEKNHRNMPSERLFSQLMHCEKFIEVLKRIEEFSQNERINIPSTYQQETILERKFNVSKSPIRCNPNANKKAINIQKSDQQNSKQTDNDQKINHSFLNQKSSVVVNKQCPKFLNKSVLLSGSKNSYLKNKDDLTGQKQEGHCGQKLERSCINGSRRNNNFENRYENQHQDRSISRGIGRRREGNGAIGDNNSNKVGNNKREDNPGRNLSRTPLKRNHSQLKIRQLQRNNFQSDGQKRKFCPQKGQEVQQESEAARKGENINTFDGNDLPNQKGSSFLEQKMGRKKKWEQQRDEAPAITRALTQMSSSANEWGQDSWGQNGSPQSRLIKKHSLFDVGLDEERNMLESIVAADEPGTDFSERKSLYRTADLDKLGKLGKNVGESMIMDTNGRS